MERPIRSTKGTSSQNYEEFDDELMKKARDMRWIFVKKGDLEPIVIGYNSVMWPQDMTTRQKLSLESQPTKTKVKLCYENKEIECSLSAVVRNAVMNGAMEYVHRKMLEGEGQLSDVSLNGDTISFSPTKLVKRRETFVSGKSKKVLKFAPTASVPEDPVLDLNSSCDESNNNNSVDTLPPINEEAVPAERFALLIEKKFGELIAVHKEHARKLTKENNNFRVRFTDLLRKSKDVMVSQPRENTEPLYFGSFDLMQLTPVGGPQTFGRLLAATLFGAEDKCELISSRMGIKVCKTKCRDAAEKKKEDLFKECITRFYPSDSEKAIRLAIRGGNQYGTDMKTRFAKCDQSPEN